MLRLPKPNFDALDVLQACLSTVEEADLKSRLSIIKNELCIAVNKAAQCAEKGEAHNVPAVSKVVDVSADELQSLYTEHMVARKGGGRSYYEYLINSSPLKKCPSCGIGIVSTLDHRLPKSRYPNLSVSPFNLVPCCFDCNKAKGTGYPDVQERQVCHPYYDDFTREQWIFAEIKYEPPLVVTFKVDAPTSWTEVNRARVAHHFGRFKLAVPFLSNGNNELVTLKRYLVRIYAAGGATAVRDHLTEEMIKYSHKLNSWQHVLYQKLANDPLFHENGFSTIAEPA